MFNFVGFEAFMAAICNEVFSGNHSDEAGVSIQSFRNLTPSSGSSGVDVMSNKVHTVFIHTGCVLICPCPSS